MSEEQEETVAIEELNDGTIRIKGTDKEYCPDPIRTFWVSATSLQLWTNYDRGPDLFLNGQCKLTKDKLSIIGNEDEWTRELALAIRAADVPAGQYVWFSDTAILFLGPPGQTLSHTFTWWQNPCQGGQYGITAHSFKDYIPPASDTNIYSSVWSVGWKCPLA